MSRKPNEGETAPSSLQLTRVLAFPPAMTESPSGSPGDVTQVDKTRVPPDLLAAPRWDGQVGCDASRSPSDEQTIEMSWTHRSPPPRLPSTRPAPAGPSRGRLPTPLSLTLEESLLAPSSPRPAPLKRPPSRTDPRFNGSGERTRPPPENTPSAISRPSKPPAANGGRGQDAKDSHTTGLMVAAACLGALVAVIIVLGLRLTRPQPGRVAMFVAGDGKAALDYFNVVVDGQPHCDARPCVLVLDAGTHTVRAQAGGYSPQEIEIAIEPGSSLALNLTLHRDCRAAAPRTP